MARRNPQYARGASAYRRAPSAEFRPVTLREAQGWGGGDFWVIGSNGKVYQVRVNGRVQLWKRDLNRVRIPFKYGMYEYGAITEREIANGEMLVPV